MGTGCIVAPGVALVVVGRAYERSACHISDHLISSAHREPTWWIRWNIGFRRASRKAPCARAVGRFSGGGWRHVLAIGIPSPPSDFLRGFLSENTKIKRQTAPLTAISRRCGCAPKVGERSHATVAHLDDAVEGAELCSPRQVRDDDMARVRHRRGAMAADGGRAADSAILRRGRQGVLGWPISFGALRRCVR